MTASLGLARPINAPGGSGSACISSSGRLTARRSYTPTSGRFPIAALLAGTVALASCSSSPDLSAPRSESSTLPAGVVARVGTFDIAAANVAKTAEHERVSPRDALELEIADALFASAALRDHIDEAPSVQAAVRARLARATLEHFYAESKSADPTDAELASATERHFIDLDRPEAFRVVHALVKNAESADGATTARARSVAEHLAEQLAPAKDEQDFRTRAEAFADRGGFEVVVETLNPVTADGRILDPNHPQGAIETYVLPFARAASRLTEPGQKSGVVSTEFGFHILMLLERTPPKTVPLDERKRRLRDEIITERTAKAKAAMIARLAADTSVSIERSADALLATVGTDHETR